MLCGQRVRSMCACGLYGSVRQRCGALRVFIGLLGRRLLLLLVELGLYGLLVEHLAVVLAATAPPFERVVAREFVKALVGHRPVVGLRRVFVSWY